MTSRGRSKSHVLMPWRRLPFKVKCVVSVVASCYGALVGIFLLSSSLDASLFATILGS